MDISPKTRKSVQAHHFISQCDITIENSISECLDAIAQTASKAGAPMSGIIACAGIQQKVPAVEYPAEGFRRILDVNITGTFLTIKHSARIFIKEETKASIVMIASMSGQVANRVPEYLGC
jgi:NAD(P)-dependent dehydrogenase (short-subunit alcohol dehydrogenase family)